MTDMVRVLRVVEYVGPRDHVERTISQSINGERDCGNGLIIRAATIGAYPEILSTSKNYGVVRESMGDLNDE